MPEDILSQEEIDALLAQVGEDDNSAPPAGEAAEGLPLPTLRELWGVGVDGARQSIETMTGRQVWQDLEPAVPVDLEPQDANDLTGQLFSVQLSGILQGQAYLYLYKEVVAAVLDLGDAAAVEQADMLEVARGLLRGVAGTWSELAGQPLEPSVEPAAELSSANWLGFGWCSNVAAPEIVFWIPRDWVDILAGQVAGSDPAAQAPARQAQPQARTSPAAAQKVESPQFGQLDDQGSNQAMNDRLDLIMDVPLNVTVELGRTRKRIREILSIGPGSVVELKRLAGEPVDILVNGKLIAKGEVVVIEENFGVRIVDIVSRAERIQKLG